MFDLSQSGYFFSTFDLEFCYHHIGMFPYDRQYLGVSWRFDSVVKYSVLRVLPFWLVFSALHFYQVSACTCWLLARTWSSRRCLDDGIGGAFDFIACQEVCRLCRADLELVGSL